MEQEIISTRRDFGKALVMGGLALLASCKKKRHRQSSNQSPIVFPPEKFFPNDGRVEYTIKAVDPEGQVVKIYTKFNDHVDAHEYKKGGIVVSELINQQRNVLEIIAEDNLGVKGGIDSKNPMLDVFEILTKEQVYNHIKDMLDTSKGFNSYESSLKGIPVHLNDEEILTDFLITRNDSTYAFIRSIDHNGNLEQELMSHKKVNEFKIHNLYLFRLPETEIHKDMKNFIQKGYSSF